MSDLDPTAADDAGPARSDDPRDRGIAADVVDDDVADPGDGATDASAAPKAGRLRRPPRPGRRAAFVAVAAAGGVAGAMIVALVAPGLAGPKASPTPSAVPSPSPATAAFVDGRSLGEASAPVTIEFWADYQCPYCSLETSAFGGALVRELAVPGRARLEYRDFAFLGQESIDAAVAARCAGRQDPAAYWRYHDLLFVQQQGENQGAFSRSNLVALVKAASLDEPSFSACLDDPSVAQAVAAETALGRSLGISSTPTMRLIGPGGTRLLKGFAPSWAAIAAAVDAVESPAPSGSATPGSTASGASPGDSAASPSPAGSGVASSPSPASGAPSPSP